MCFVSFPAGPPAYASADGVSAPPAVASTSAPPTSNSVEMDLLGSLADVFSSNALAIVPADSTSVETNGQPNAPSFSTSQPSTQVLAEGLSSCTYGCLLFICNILIIAD